MKILSDKTMKTTGKRRVTVELDDGEKFHALREDGFYRTGYPLQEVVPGHILLDSEQVVWCPLGQEWVS